MGEWGGGGSYQKACKVPNTLDPKKVPDTLGEATKKGEVKRPLFDAKKRNEGRNV